MKPTGLQDLFPGEEDVGLDFTEDFGKGVMSPGFKILAFGAGWSRDS